MWETIWPEGEKERTSLQRTNQHVEGIRPIPHDESSWKRILRDE